MAKMASMILNLAGSGSFLFSCAPAPGAGCYRRFILLSPLLDLDAGSNEEGGATGRTGFSSVATFHCHLCRTELSGTMMVFDLFFGLLHL